ncbi:MAG: acetyl-CoA carboxylase, carboxyltransferase subunit beta [Clostridiales bacterium]|nr:acetyl-CoA carboxylase, carboxyltransferase subunit beta [Clostridiales bacterium]MDY4061093.1 acetyl-CoA carboxylase, carboxyltransferase subunit beta [Anaerovoracaceae bacterium]
MNNFFKEKKNLFRTINHLLRTEDNIEQLKRDNELLRCPNCGETAKRHELRENLYVCKSCDYHGHLTAYARIKSLCDKGSFREFSRWIKGYDPLHFPGYGEKIKETQDKCGIPEAVITGTCRIDGNKAVICVMDGRFLMASMGMAVGEKITRATEYAGKKSLPLIIFSASGGARMQEGIISLMQMAKTSAAIKKFSDEGNLFVSVMTDPTTGGVTASFASLGDIQLAEPKALIGFAGARVIRQTIGEELPQGFQSAEFLMDHGFLDRVVHRRDMRRILAEILELHNKLPQKAKRKIVTADLWVSMNRYKTFDCKEKKWKTEEQMEAFERVELARSKERPTSKEYIDSIFDSFIPMAGDRLYGEDRSIIGGIGKFRGLPVTIIGQQKGRTLEDNLKCRFGMPNPEGYRKAERLMLQAEKFGRPVITFVDTPGAYPGKEAEENGQGSAIAHCIFTLSCIKVPVINIFIGEGGSGGALAIGFGDKMIMMENSIFSILSPEGFASILWKDPERWKDAAKHMKLTAFELLNMGICDQVIMEEKDKAGGIRFSQEMFERVGDEIAKALEETIFLKPSALVEKRYRKLRRIGKDLV